MGDRIQNLESTAGDKIEADKSYRVAGWATVGSQSEGAPIWDVVASYLRDAKTIRLDKIETPVLRGVDGNPGIA